MSSAISIRAGASSDLEALAEIYNHYVLHSHATFEQEAVSIGERLEWFAGFEPLGPYRIVVAERSGEILRYATSSRFHPKQIYHASIEVGIYVAPDSCGGGIGSKLYRTLFGELANEPSVERLVAGVTLPNASSIALHLKFNFQIVGTFSRIANRDGDFYDLCWLDRPARPSQVTASDL